MQPKKRRGRLSRFLARASKCRGTAAWLQARQTCRCGTSSKRTRARNLLGSWNAWTGRSLKANAPRASLRREKVHIEASVGRIGTETGTAALFVEWGEPTDENLGREKLYFEACMWLFSAKNSAWSFRNWVRHGVADWSSRPSWGWRHAAAPNDALPMGASGRLAETKCS